MATNMYIKLEGNVDAPIEGGSTSKGHEKESEILSWSHGFSQPTSPVRSTAGAGTVEHATHSNFNFTKYLDGATDNILLHCWGGTQIDKATVTCFRSDGSKTNEPVKYLEVIMEHVVISNYSISGGAGDVPIENISLDYGTIEYKYTPQGRDKGKAGTQVPIKHNLETREVS